MNIPEEELSCSCSYCGGMGHAEKMTLTHFVHPVSKGPDINDRFNSWSWYCEGCIKDYKLTEKFRRDAL